MQCGQCCEKPGDEDQVAPAFRVADGDVAVDIAAQDISTAELIPVAAPPGGPRDADSVLGRVGPQEPEPPPTKPEALAAAAQEPELKEARPAAFSITVPLVQGKCAGIAVDLSEGSYLRVCKVDAKGPVPEYNAKVSVEERVCVGDFICGVNNVAGSARRMTAALQATGDVTLAFRRPYNFKIENLDRGLKAVGLDLSYHPRSASLVVKEVLNEGAIPEWNTKASAATKVKEDDHIVAVNGHSGSPQELHKLIKDSTVLTLEISRPRSD